MKENTDISERLRKMLDLLGVTANKFAKTLEYSRSQVIYDILNGKSSPSFDFFNRFCDSEYSEFIDLSWLITGKGEMKHNKYLDIRGNQNMVAKSDAVYGAPGMVGDVKVSAADKNRIKKLKAEVKNLESRLEDKDLIIQRQEDLIELLRKSQDKAI